MAQSCGTAKGPARGIGRPREAAGALGRRSCPDRSGAASLPLLCIAPWASPWVRRPAMVLAWRSPAAGHLSAGCGMSHDADGVIVRFRLAPGPRPRIRTGAGASLRSLREGQGGLLHGGRHPRYVTRDAAVLGWPPPEGSSVGHRDRERGTAARPWKSDPVRGLISSI